MDYIIDNVEFITELVKSGFIGIVGIFFIGLAIWIKMKEDRWNFKNIGIGLLAGGMALLLISVSMVVDSLQDGGVIAIDRNNPVCDQGAGVCTDICDSWVYYAVKTHKRE